MELLNRSLLVALIAQFQTYCRDLHDGTIEVHVRSATAPQRELVRSLMSQGRRLYTQTPRTRVLTNDFNRVGFNIVRLPKAEGAATETALRLLDVAVDFRNAIVRGNETQVAKVTATGRIEATLTSYRLYRRAITGLASALDQAATRLATVLQIPAPW